VNSLLLLARTDGAGLAVREQVDLAVLVERAWAAVRSEAAARNLRADFSVAGAPAYGDPALLERIAGNLVENAVRHNVDGGWLEIVTQPGPQWSLLRVRSSGGLLDPGAVPELFEPFRRAGVARTARTGAGLGLSIVRAAVQAHGGTVVAEPVVGGGLTVVVHLPAGPGVAQL
jgi:signal transduction histidine kinase